MPVPQAQYVASSDIYPCRFITPDGAYKVKQAGVGDPIIGVSAEGTTMVAIDGMTNASCVYAARTGMPVRYYSIGTECNIESGAAFSANAYLTADADGKAVTATDGSDTNFGAQARQAATDSGQKIRCIVVPHGSQVPS